MDTSKNQNTVEVRGKVAKFVSQPELGCAGGCSCAACFFEGTPELCRQAPCIGSERTDGRHGYFRKVAIFNT
jgi:hypothetical protein